jgi:hypothetical protein
LYRKDKKLGDLKRWLVYSLMSIRFISLFFVLLLLLSPVFKYLRVIFEEPIIIIARDNSESLKKYQQIGNNDELLKNLPEFLEDEFLIKDYVFGDKLTENKLLDYSEQETDFDPIFKEIDEKFTNYNIGALIIASDGIYNKGNNPVYSVKNLNFPIYTISLGDTTKRNDLIIKNVYSNKISFAGDLFPVEILINAYGFKGKQTNLKIFNQGKELKSIPIDIDKFDFSKLVKFDLLAEKGGLQTYTIRLEPKEGEFNLANNSQELVIDIVDNKKKILLLSQSVHPDIGAIQKSLESNKSIVVESFTIDDFNKPVTDYQLIVLHQLPSNQFNIQKILNEIYKNNLPVLFILGQNTNIQVFNTLKSGIEIRQNKNLYEQALPVFNQSFKLFETDDELINLIKECPPLNVAFGDFVISDNIYIMYYQKIKGIATNYPLIAFSQSANNEQLKFGIIFGEGIWNWRMKDYLLNDNHTQFDILINKIVNYLAVDIKKDRFMVFNNRLFKENEDVTFRAELYNQSFELVNSSEIKMVIINDNKKEFQYIFSKSDKSYHLNAGRLTVGNYKYKATTQFDNKNYQKSGEFKVVPLNVEHIDLSANHNILNQLSSQSGAKMFSLKDLNLLKEELMKNDNIKKISHSVTDLVNLVEIRWLLFIISLLLGVEWFIRKYFGAY